MITCVLASFTDVLFLIGTASNENETVPSLTVSVFDGKQCDSEGTK